MDYPVVKVRTEPVGHPCLELCCKRPGFDTITMCLNQIGLADPLLRPELDVGKDIFPPVLVARNAVGCPARPIGGIGNLC